MRFQKSFLLFALLSAVLLSAPASASSGGSVPSSGPSVCGYVFSPDDDHDHDWAESDEIPPTCTDFGMISYECILCGETYTELIPPFGGDHAYEVVEIIPAVYDSSGQMTTPSYIWYSCSVCGDEYQQVVGASPSGPPLIEGEGGDGMQDATAALGKTLLSGIWKLFGIYVPGFSFTFGQMWLGVLLASISILVVRMIFGFGGGPRGMSPRTSSASRPRISKERRNDEF